MLEELYERYEIYDDIPERTDETERCFKELQELLDIELYMKVEKLVISSNEECKRLGFISGFKAGVSLTAECIYNK